MGEGGIEPLDVGRVEHALPLRLANQTRDQWLAVFENPARGVHDPWASVLLDDLANGDALPGTQGRSAAPLSQDRLAKGGLNGCDVAAEPVDRDQQRAGERVVFSNLPLSTVYRGVTE